MNEMLMCRFNKMVLRRQRKAYFHSKPCVVYSKYLFCFFEFNAFELLFK